MSSPGERGGERRSPHDEHFHHDHPAHAETSADVPSRCPSCSAGLVVVKLECAACGTAVQGRYSLCPGCRLEGEMRRLFNLFLEARGNLKDVQRSLGLSYPTVRQRIESMFQALAAPAPRPDPLAVLQRVRNREITVDEAARLLRGDNRPADRE